MVKVDFLAPPPPAVEKIYYPSDCHFFWQVFFLMRGRGGKKIHFIHSQPDTGVRPTTTTTPGVANVVPISNIKLYSAFAPFWGKGSVPCTGSRDESFKSVPKVSRYEVSVSTKSRLLSSFL